MAYANWLAIALDRTACFADETELLRAISFGPGGLSFPSYAGGGIFAAIFNYTIPEEKSMETYKGVRLTDGWFSVRLVDFATRSVPILGITFAQVLAYYGYEGAAVETNVPIVITDWSEQGGGDYWYKIGLTEFANFGKYTIRIHAVNTISFADRSFVVEVQSIANEVWDEVLTSATHDVTNSAGRKLRNVFATTGTAQAGGPNSIQLAIGELATDHIYNQNLIYINKGLGAGQVRIIIEYDGTTKTAVVNRAWDINPNGTSEYVIIPSADVPIANQGIAQSGGPAIIRLAITASPTNDYYLGMLVYIASGAGAGQARIITGYVGANTTATVYPAWAIQPDNTSVYKLMPLGPSMIDAIEPTLEASIIDAFWNELTTGHDIVNSFGQMLNNTRANVATGGALGSITLDAGASIVNDFYNGALVFISKGLGIGQTRVITAYDGVTKIASVQPNFAVAPGALSEYVIIPASSIPISSIVNGVWNELTTGHNVINSFGQMLNNARANTALAGTPSTIQLDAGASVVNDFYNGNIIFISNGLGVGQARIITAYDGVTKIATVQPDWVINPGAGSEYVIIPSSSTSVATIANAILDADLTTHLGPAIDNRTLGGMLAQSLNSKYQNRTLVKAVADVPAQGITPGMVASGIIQYEIVKISLTRNFAAPDFLYYNLWRYNATQEVVEVKASLGTIW